MSKKGFLKIKFYSVESTRIDNKKCLVRARLADAEVTISVPDQTE